ncbi:MAG: anaerobic sulfite reductase subunit AsrB [Fibrobacteres bacterium]|nr:anaerobic sulfite reductase subunit AsrB [Fibrobacterota bacterium]
MNTNIYTPIQTEVISIEIESAIEWTFRIKWEGTKPSPGQFFQLSIPLIGEAPISVSGIGENFIEMTIRNVGRVTESVFRLKPGDKIYLRGPYGNKFPIEKFHDRHLIIAAGGSGVAPVRGLINSIETNPEKVKQLTLLFGFRKPSAIIFKNDIERWSKSFPTLITVDEAEAGWNGKTGVIPQHLKELSITDKSVCDIIIVGPPAMMRFTALAYLELGFKTEQIWLSFERHMSCGVGKCGHCKIDNVYVCLDGPIFNYEKARHLVD